MMLHRHFETEKSKNITTTEDVAQEPFVSEVFPPEEPAEAPKKRGRPKKD